MKILTIALFVPSVLSFTVPHSPLSETYKPSKVQEEFDTIVIGSGIGGLATASLLAQSKQKHKVLVLEQHYEYGGCCHTFTKKGFSFGTGIHYVGEVGDEESSSGLHFRELLKAITQPNDPIQWSRMPENYDTILIGNDESEYRTYEIYAKENQERLKEQFPLEAEAINQFYTLCEKARKGLRRAILWKILPRTLLKPLLRTKLINLFDKGYHKYSKLTLKEVVDSLTDNDDLKTCLCYNWGDYGSIPSETPFIMHALLMAHYENGAYYPTGGPSMIPTKIIPTITATGGKIVTNAPVKRILVDSANKAIGVEMKDGTEIKAKQAVISDAGFLNTYKYLLPSSFRDELDERLARIGGFEKGLSTSLTGLTLFVGLEGDHVKDIKLPRHQLWMYPSADLGKDLQQLASKARADVQSIGSRDLVPFFIGAPSGKDNAWSRNYPGKSTLEIITAMPWDVFEKYAPSTDKADGASDLGGKPKTHGKEYSNIKARLAQVMWNKARSSLIESGASASHLPEKIEDTAVYELGTPLTFAHFLRADHGAFYGLMHDIKRFKPEIFFDELRPEVAGIRGLYLTGQDVGTCGLVGALSAAYLTASKVLGVLNPLSMAKLDSTSHTGTDNPVDDLVGEELPMIVL